MNEILTKKLRKEINQNQSESCEVHVVTVSMRLELFVPLVASALLRGKLLLEGTGGKGSFQAPITVIAALAGTGSGSGVDSFISLLLPSPALGLARTWRSTFFRKGDRGRLCEKKQNLNFYSKKEVKREHPSFEDNIMYKQGVRGLSTDLEQQDAAFPLECTWLISLTAKFTLQRFPLGSFSLYVTVD